MAGHQAEGPDPRSLWFIPPDGGESSRPTLTRKRVVAEALTVISMDAALAFRLIYDYTLGFALAGPASPAEQRLGDSAARQQLHAFLRSLPASRFPTLAAHGAHAWADDREERFASGLDTLICGLQAAQR